MAANTPDWTNLFTELFHRSVKKYQQGHEKVSGMVTKTDAEFLKSIGYSEQEFFDFVEDNAKGGEPTVETALSVAAVRRDYFMKEQSGKVSDKTISMADLPAKDAEVEGIGWLPRLIPKAEAKLRGEMPPDLMYGCGGDRKFFKTHQIDPAEFLRQTWMAAGNHGKLVTWVKSGGR